MARYEEMDEPDRGTQMLAHGVYDAETMTREARRNSIHNAGLQPGRRIIYNAPGAGLPIDNFIRGCYAHDAGSVRKPNEKGLTPLHAAAMHKNLLAIKTLLELGVRDDLSKRDNSLGKTPVGCAEFVLKHEREAAELQDGSKKWRGHSDDSLEVVWTLRHEAGEDVGTLEEYKNQRKGLHL